MVSTKEIINRYLIAREEVNENASALAGLLKAGRGIDAIEIEKDKLNMAKMLFQYSKIAYCMAEINGHLIIMYPEEQREKYMDIMPRLAFGGPMVEYAGFSYSEAKTVFEGLNQAEIQYQTSFDENGKTRFLIAEKDEHAIQDIIQLIKEEESTELGKKYYISSNICWLHALNQISHVMNYNGVSFIGSEGGSSGIRIDEQGATVMSPQHECVYLRKTDTRFEQKLIDTVMNELNGKELPVKAFYGNAAEIVSKDIKREFLPKCLMSKKEAMEILNIKNITDINNINIQDITAKQQEAMDVLIRMTMCRKQQMEEFHEFKLSKEEKHQYLKMHMNNMQKIQIINKEQATEFADITR